MLSTPCRVGAADGYNLLHWASKHSLVEQVRALTNTIERETFIKLATTKNRDGKTPSTLTTSEEIKKLIESACIPINHTYSLVVPPTVLIFYSTKGRLGAEEEKDSLHEFFHKNRITPQVYKDPSSKELESEIKSVTEGTSLSALIVAIMSHGVKGKVDLADRRVELTSIVAHMDSESLKDKPKVRSNATT